MHGLSFIKKNGCVMPIDSVTKELLMGVTQASVSSGINEITTMTLTVNVLDENNQTCMPLKRTNEILKESKKT